MAGNLVAAPKTLRYEHDGGLPVAIEAKSNRRTYVPNNGQTFLPGQTIRLNLNSPTSPAVLSADEDGEAGFTYLVMPVQIRS